MGEGGFVIVHFSNESNETPNVNFFNQQKLFRENQKVFHSGTSFEEFCQMKNSSVKIGHRRANFPKMAYLTLTSEL